MRLVYSVSQASQPGNTAPSAGGWLAGWAELCTRSRKTPPIANLLRDARFHCAVHEGASLSHHRKMGPLWANGASLKWKCVMEERPRQKNATCHEEIFIKHVPDKRLASNTCEELLTLNKARNKQTNKQNMARQRRHVNWKLHKRCSVSISFCNCKSNWQCKPLQICDDDQI